MILCANHMITGDGTTLLQNYGIRINEMGLIENLDSALELKKQYPKDIVKDYGNATILPGLFDMHVHLGYWLSQPDSFLYNDQLITLLALKNAQDAFSKGITTVRDLSSPANLCKNLKIAERKGYATIPRIIHSDRGICMSGGHGWDDDIEQADGPWEIRSAIRRQIRDGAEWIKILTSHRSNIPEFTQEELNAAVHECHRRNIKCAVHAGCQPSIQMCINAGFDTIEHGTLLTQEQALQMKDNGQAWVPTIFAYTYLYEVCVKNMDAHKETAFNDPVMAKEMRDFQFFEPAYLAYRDHFKDLYDTGVTICAGTDMVLYQAPVLPLSTELGLMVQYGITPLQAIQTATSNSAKVLGIEDEVGVLKKGYLADVLVVNGDVSRDIACISDVENVYQNGKIVF
ncbi:MAG: amidohydrolase family protein [Lachnospiraceae bacterium]